MYVCPLFSILCSKASVSCRLHAKQTWPLLLPTCDDDDVTKAAIHNSIMTATAGVRMW